MQNKENFDKLSCSSFSDSENTQSKSNYQWLNTISNASPNITTETQTKIPENGIAIDENFDVTPEERFEEFKSVVHSLLKKNNTDLVENTEPKNFADPKNIPIKRPIQKDNKFIEEEYFKWDIIKSLQNDSESENLEIQKDLAAFDLAQKKVATKEREFKNYYSFKEFNLEQYTDLHKNDYRYFSYLI